MPDIGNIQEHWNKRQETLASDSWERSYEQRFVTGYGSDFCLTSLMERIWIDDQGQVVRRSELPAEVVRVSELANDAELAAHAAAIQEHLTALVAIKRARRLAAEAALAAAQAAAQEVAQDVQ